MELLTTPTTRWKRPPTTYHQTRSPYEALKANRTGAFGEGELTRRRPDRHHKAGLKEAGGAAAAKLEPRPRRSPPTNERWNKL
jgi:hypothetical protein